MFIRPALDPASETADARLKVRDPDTMQFLADAGEEKPDSEYWMRRREEGGVEERVGGQWPTKAAAVAPAPEPEVEHSAIDDTSHEEHQG